MSIGMLLMVSSAIFITAVVMTGGQIEPSTKYGIAFLLVIIYLAGMWDAWFSNGRVKLALEWAKNNRIRFIWMSTIDSFYFWAVLILASAVFISGWFLLVGALLNAIFCHANGIDALGPPPAPRYIDLQQIRVRADHMMPEPKKRGRPTK